jgi:hypothetical protein
MGMLGWFRRAPPAPTEEQLRVAQALVDYPPYAPPDWNPDPLAYGEESKKYAEFFLGSKQARLHALRAFLAKFDVSLNLDDAGLMAVSAWFTQYADLLVGDLDNDAVQDAYGCFTVPWTGTLSGLNPIFDLGIYYAECLWYRRTRLKWVVYRGPESGFAVHLISGVPGSGQPFNPISWTYVECRIIRNSKTLKKRRMPGYDSPWDRSESFYVHVLSQAPPGRRSRKK